MIPVLLLLAACSEAEEQEPVNENTGETEEQATDEHAADDAVVGMAEEFIGQLNEGQYEEATEKFDETMREQLGPEELEELWISLEDQLGELVDYEYDRTETVDGGYEVILINGVFHDADATFQVTVDGNEEIAGFYIQ